MQRNVASRGLLVAAILTTMPVAAPALGQSANTFGNDGMHCADALARQGDERFEESVVKWVAGYWSGLNIGSQMRNEGYYDVFPFVNGEREVFSDLIDGCIENADRTIYSVAGQIYTQLRFIEPAK